MRSQLVYSAGLHVPNRFLLATIVMRAVRTLHINSSRTEDTANRVFSDIAEGRFVDTGAHESNRAAKSAIAVDAETVASEARLSPALNSGPNGRDAAESGRSLSTALAKAEQRMDALAGQGDDGKKLDRAGRAQAEKVEMSAWIAAVDALQATLLVKSTA